MKICFRDPNYDPKIKIWHPTTSENTYLHLEINTMPKFIDNYQEGRAKFWLKIKENDTVYV